jgi:glycosyltransferase involved in cell wall biosynthesis
MITMSLMALQRATRAPKPHVAILSRFSKPKLEIPLRLLGGTLRAMVTWCEAQRDYAIERMGISPGRIFLVKHYVDEIFWNGAPAPPTDLIASAGAENRDYATLIEALRDAPVRCHVATDRVRIDGPLMSRRFTVAQLAQTATPNVTFGRRNLRELRELYARSRFVVLPLQPNNIDNGVTVLLEAMAMGKAVICSQTEGQRGVLQHGVTGLYVPPKDPRAMREAILSLWNDPARAEAMGRAGRAYIEKHHTLEGFCRNVRTAIDVALDGGAATRTGDIPVERTPYAA